MRRENKKYSQFIILCLFFILVQLFLVNLAFGIENPAVIIVRSRNIEPYNKALNGFRKEIDPNVTVKLFDLEGKEGLKGAKDLNPNIILAIGTEAAKACKDLFKTETIVFTMVLDPVEEGVIDTYNKTGANITGVLLTIPIETQFRKFKEVVPHLKTIGMMYYTDTKRKDIQDIYSRLANKLDLNLIAIPVQGLKDIPPALDRLVKESDALWAQVDNSIYTPQTAQEIILTTFKNKIPFMAFSSPYVKAGALLALECDYYDIGMQTGEIVNSILKGTAPGDIPVAFPRKVNLVINKHTADIIGLKIKPDILKEAVIFDEQ